MRLVLHKLLCLRDERRASVPLQYAIVAAGTALATMMIVETTSNKVAEKFEAITLELKKVRF